MSDLKTADIELIQRIIPHRYPFLLVDRVVDIDGTKAGVGIKNVTMNEPQFTGHFPNMPVMPGVLMVEAMAQTAGLLLLRKLPIDVETLRGGGKVWKFKGRATVEGEVACECEFTAMMDLPK